MIRRGLFINAALLLAGLAGATPAMAATVIAHQTASSTDSQIWQGDCQSSDGRFGATVKVYLSNRDGDRLNGFYYTSEAQLVTISTSNLTSGVGVQAGVGISGLRYDNQGAGPTDAAADAEVVIGPDDNGYTSFFPADNVPYKDSGGMNAGWWYSRYARAWSFDVYRYDLDIGDNGSTDCSIEFAYGYPVNASQQNRPTISGTPPTGPTNLPDLPTARSELKDLTVAPQSGGSTYDRDKFGDWSTRGDGCSTQRDVLKRDGWGVSLGAKPSCTPSGAWRSQFDNRWFSSYDSDNIVVDHLVPLAEAWRSGANDWSKAKLNDFYNDFSAPELIMSSKSANSSKSDNDPSDWQPRSLYWCNYARSWIAVKHKYALTLQQSEKTALSNELDACH